MASYMYRTITIDVGSESKYLEGYAGESITPGSLCSMSAASNDTYLLNTEKERCVPILIAVENKYGSSGINGIGYTNPEPNKLAIDIKYAMGDYMYLRHFRSGDVAYVIAMEAVTKGDLLAPMTTPAGEFEVCLDVRKCLFLALETTLAAGRVKAAAIY